MSQQLTQKQQHLFESSIEHCFFEQIFCKIDESQFSILYSDKSSRPNVPVNQLVGSLILKHLFDWTYEELFKHLSFNLLTRHAIGIDRLDSDVFAEASLFNFQNRLFRHYAESGRDLLMEVFDNLTHAQLKDFGVETDIQRGDSFLIGSNIVDYSRLQLLIEVLKRFYLVLDEHDQLTYQDHFNPYLKKTSGQYIYRVVKADLPKELSALGHSYHALHQALATKYSEVHVFEIFSRVYHEHFSIVSDQIEVCPSSKLSSNILMSPDDDQATYRDKGAKTSKGYVGHLSETANPKNDLQLITDVVVEPNNIGDAELLEKRLPEMIRKTPALKEYFTDGQYGSPAADEILHSNDIKQYQSGIRGRPSYGGLRIHQKEDKTTWVKCGGNQDVKAIKRRGWSAKFDHSICENCPLADKCNTRLSGVKKGKPKRTFYFNEKKILAHLRINNFDTLPPEKRTLRPAVEASVRQVQCGMKNGKVRVRTKKRVNAYMTITAMAINLKRIHASMIKAGTSILERIKATLKDKTKLTGAHYQTSSSIQNQHCNYHNTLMAA